MVNDVRILRKEGKLEEAYQLGANLLAEAPGDIWIKRELAWVVYDILKRLIAERSNNLFLSWMQVVAKLSLLSQEKMFAEQIQWLYVKQIANFKNPFSEISKLLDIARYIPVKRPSDSYSALIRSCHNALEEDHSGYIKIMDRLGFDAFLERDDYEYYLTEQGRKIMPLAEQLYNRYSKAMMSVINVEKQRGDVISKELNESINLFINKLSNLIQLHPEYEFALYNKVKLMMALGHREDLVGMYIPFVKKKSSEFWVWDLLGEIYENKDKRISLACYCKGLLCRTPKAMIVGLKEVAAVAMFDLGYLSEAKAELESCVEIRIKNWGKLNYSLQGLIGQDWFKQTESSKNNIAFYRKHSSLADELLWSDSLRPILITYVNREKKIASFITDDDKKSFFNYSRLYVQEININDVLLVDYNGVEPDSISNIKFCKRMDDAKLSCFYKEVSGKLIIKDGASYGFVSGVFISTEVLKKVNITNGDNIKALAIKSFDKKKSYYSWRAIKIIGE